MSLGVEMMVKSLLASLGVKPEQIMGQVQSIAADVAAFKRSQERLERKVDALLKHADLNPRDYDNAPTTEIDHNV